MAESHPGGELFVKAFGGCDATEAFLSYHRRNFPHERKKDYLIGDIKTNKEVIIDTDYLELCSLIDEILPRSKSFAPFHYYMKIYFIIIITFSLEYYMHTTGNYKWYISSILGVFMALVGLNIQHDANHGAISKFPFINRFLGLTQNWIGGSSIDWIHQHVVQHHIHCNDIVHDPDITGSSILRLNPLSPLLSFQKGQYVYFFLLIGFFGYIMVIHTLWNIIEGIHLTPYSKFLVNHRIFETFSSIIFFVRWFILPLYIKPSIYTLLHIAPMFIVGGYYLAFFFIISHNFNGVFMFDSREINTNKKLQSFLYRQVVSSCNVGGPWLAFINGGLNYQIEHHLFPRISHCYYAKIAPIVSEFCKKKNIPYVHFPTIYENIQSCIKHLYKLGHKKEYVFEKIE